MTYILDYTTRARHDIDRITGWYLAESGSIEIAMNWHDGILTALDRLIDDPESFSLAHESDDFPFVLRQLLYGSGKRKNYRALFRIKGNIVEVLAIRHHSQRDVTPDDFG